VRDRVPSLRASRQDDLRPDACQRNSCPESDAGPGAGHNGNATWRVLTRSYRLPTRTRNQTAGSSNAWSVRIAALEQAWALGRAGAPLAHVTGGVDAWALRSQ